MSYRIKDTFHSYSSSGIPSHGISPPTTMSHRLCLYVKTKWKLIPRKKEIDQIITFKAWKKYLWRSWMLFPSKTTIIRTSCLCLNIKSMFWTISTSSIIIRNFQQILKSAHLQTNVYLHRKTQSIISFEAYTSTSRQTHRIPPIFTFTTSHISSTSNLQISI